MDARDKLRLYLEQRRELGETELVLDQLSVEEALKLLGARPAGPGSVRGSSSAVEHGDRPRGPAAGSSAARAAAPDTADWREALRATGAGPDAPKATPPAPATPPVPPAVHTPRPVPPPGFAPLDGAPAAPVAAPRGIVIGAAAAGVVKPEPAESLADIAARVAACTRCRLYATATNPVPGEGDPNADFMCVGEAPGQTEDETGRPFVGAAGQLLDKILGAIGLQRQQVFIANVLKHRPPGNRNPLPDEVLACSPYLLRQIELVRPKVILALGTFAAQTLLQSPLALGKLRGQEHRYYGVPLVVTYHPAALLRNPSWKRPTWEDVQLARRILDRALAAGA